jgi:hypothetical protein
MSQDVIEFAAFDVEDLRVLQVGDAVALPEMGASYRMPPMPVTPLFIDDDEDALYGGSLDTAAPVAGSVSSSSSCCCCN